MEKRIIGFLSWNIAEKNNQKFLQVKIESKDGIWTYVAFKGNATLGKLQAEVAEGASKLAEVCGTVDLKAAEKGFNSFSSIKSFRLIDSTEQISDVASMKKRIRTLIAGKESGIKDEELRAFVLNAYKRQDLFQAPYSDKLFAYRGGLAVYTLIVLQVVSDLCKTIDGVKMLCIENVNVDTDLLKAAACLHRLGNINLYHMTDAGGVARNHKRDLVGENYASMEIFFSSGNLSDERKLLLGKLINEIDEVDFIGKQKDPLTAETLEGRMLKLARETALTIGQYELIEKVGSDVKIVRGYNGNFLK